MGMMAENPVVDVLLTVVEGLEESAAKPKNKKVAATIQKAADLIRQAVLDVMFVADCEEPTDD